MRSLGPPKRIASSDSAARRLKIETYFGFFAESVMMAVGTSLSHLTGERVRLDAVSLSTTNTIKLRWSDVDTVILPRMAIKVEVNYIYALTQQDVTSLINLAGDRIPFHKMLEQTISTAAEPFNFITKRRNRLNGVEVSRNVTGFTAHHLDGEVNYTMATGHFTVHKRPGFSLRFLVTAAGRDQIEERTMQKSAQRALFSINEGAYICRPQWEPPPPPPGLESGAAISEAALGNWLQTFFGRNDGMVPNKLFHQPVGLHCAPTNIEALHALAEQGGPPTVARLQINGDKALEVIAVLPAATANQMIRLSRSGQERFLGDVFRALFGDSAELWEAFSQTDFKWSLLGVRKIPVDAMDAVTSRLEGGGLALRQVARMDEGQLEWMLAIPPLTWHWMMRLTAKGLSLPSSGLPNRQNIFRATGWGQGRIPWTRLIAYFSDIDLQDLIRLLTKARASDAVLAAVAEAIDGPFRERWLEAMPVMQRERVARYQMAQGEGARRELELTRMLIPLNRRNRVPKGRLSNWLSLYSEFYYSHGSFLIDLLLPLRHLVYGMDRGSLTRLLFDAKGDLLGDMLSCAEFPVVDQVRRATSPSFGMRILEDIAEARTRISAYTAQEAQLEFYRMAFRGMTQGRYLLRGTPGQRLRELIRELDEEE